MFGKNNIKRAYTLSKEGAPWLSVEIIEAALIKCKELKADGFFPEVLEKGDYLQEQKLILYFVRQPDYEHFEHIKEAMNPTADIFMHSEVIATLIPNFSGFEITWVDAEKEMATK